MSVRDDHLLRNDASVDCCQEARKDRPGTEEQRLAKGRAHGEPAADAAHDDDAEYASHEVKIRPKPVLKQRGVRLEEVERCGSRGPYGKARTTCRETIDGICRHDDCEKL